MTRSQILTLLTVLCCHIGSYAQFLKANSEMVNKVAGRTLLVEKDDFSCLSNVEESFSQYWKMFMKIEFKTAEEITMMLTPSDATGYLVLTGDARQEVSSQGGKYQYGDVMGYVIYLGEKAGRRNDFPIERDFVVKVSLPYCVSSGPQLLLLSRLIQAQLDEKITGVNDASKMKKTKVEDSRTAKLKNFPLALTSSMIQASEEEIKGVYPYPFELMSDEKLKRTITTGFSDFVVPLFVWSDDKFRWSLMPISLQDGYPMADSRITKIKPNLTKKSFDEDTEFLGPQRNKEGISLSDLKSLAGLIEKAQEE